MDIELLGGVAFLILAFCMFRIIQMLSKQSEKIDCALVLLSDLVVKGEEEAQ